MTITTVYANDLNDPALGAHGWPPVASHGTIEAMARSNIDVDSMLDAMNHPRRDDIDRLRHAIKIAHPGLTEHLKWNAPSFRDTNDDCVTFRLQPGDRVEIIFHRGAKKRTDHFTFTDPTGLLSWLAPDRAIIAFADREAVTSRLADVVRLVGEWVASINAA